jgi:hypothetical protein
MRSYGERIPRGKVGGVFFSFFLGESWCITAGFFYSLQSILLDANII